MLEISFNTKTNAGKSGIGRPPKNARKNDGEASSEPKQKSPKLGAEEEAGGSGSRKKSSTDSSNSKQPGSYKIPRANNPFTSREEQPKKGNLPQIKIDLRLIKNE